MANMPRKWICAYGNGLVGEITSITSVGDCRVRVYHVGQGAKSGRRWAVGSFTAAMAKADELAHETSDARDWVEANRD